MLGGSWFPGAVALWYKHSRVRFLLWRQVRSREKLRLADLDQEAIDESTARDSPEFRTRCFGRDCGCRRGKRARESRGLPSALLSAHLSVPLARIPLLSKPDAGAAEATQGTFIVTSH